MSQLVLDIPDDTLLSLKLSGDTAANEIRLAASVKLYELGRLSSGGAARLAGVPRVLFLSKLVDYGVDTFRVSGWKPALANLEGSIEHCAATTDSDCTGRRPAQRSTRSFIFRKTP